MVWDGVRAAWVGGSKRGIRGIEIGRRYTMSL